jgi:uncharacterized protein (TIGR02145 family)
LIFEAVSDAGVEMYIDDVSWTAFPPATTTNYYCSVTGGTCGTVTTNTVTVAVNAFPTASISPASATICSGTSTTLTASGGGTYLWSSSNGDVTGSTATTITDNPTSNTTYTVTVTNGAGCSATASATVTVNTGVPAPPVAGTNTPSANNSIIVWNWNTVSGATSYRWGTTSSYSSATDNGISVSYTQTGITCNTFYTLYVWAYNACGNSSYTTLTQISSACGLQCGSQVWMTANMNVGTTITVASYPTQQTVSQKWCYGDIPANCTTYGGLYQWATAMNISNTYNTNLSTITLANENCNPCGPTTYGNGVQGICPTGYHIPSDLEWSQYEYCTDVLQTPEDVDPATNTLSYYQTATNFRGSTNPGVGPADKMKVTSSNLPAWDGTNTSGFYALPAGFSVGGTSSSLGSFAGFWLATEIDALTVWSQYLYSSNPQELRANSTKTGGLSVRCLKD